MSEFLSNSATPRALRKSIVEHLANQQKADAAVALKIRDHILVANKKILGSFSKLLDSYAPDISLSSEQKALLRAVAPDSSIEDWLLVRKQLQECTAEQNQCRVEKDKAQQAYDQDSPMGFMSRWGKDTMGQRISLALKADNDRVATNLARIESRKRSIEDTIRIQAEKFMRSALQQSAIESLCKTPSIVRTEVTGALSEMSTTVNALWTHHAKTQVDSLDQMSQATTGLLLHYRETTHTRMIGKG